MRTLTIAICLLTSSLSFAIQWETGQAKPTPTAWSANKSWARFRPTTHRYTHTKYQRQAESLRLWRETIEGTRPR
jgi:hypothetical protein